MSAALDARGLKRVCVSCGIRFYDLNKRPINCPNCETEFSGEIKLKGRRGRAAAIEEAPKKVANDVETEVEARDEGVVSLEDVAAMEEGADEDADDTLEVDDEDDIASLEELEEDTDLEVPVEKKKE